MIKEYLPNKYRHTYTISWPECARLLDDKNWETYYKKQLEDSVEKARSRFEKQGYIFEEVYYNGTLYADNRPYIELVTLLFTKKDKWGHPDLEFLVKRKNAKTILETNPDIFTREKEL